MVKGTNGRHSEVCLARILFLLLLRGGRDVAETELAFEQYMEVASLFDKVDCTFGCINVIWSTSDEKD